MICFGWLVRFASVIGCCSGRVYLGLRLWLDLDWWLYCLAVGYLG